MGGDVAGFQQKAERRHRLAVRSARPVLTLLALLLSTGCLRSASPERPRILWFGGDVHLGLDGGAALDGFGLDGPLVVNLEGPISRAPRASRADALFNPPDTAQRLVAAGVVAAGVDNNHALDDGADGLTFTTVALRAAGIEPLGATTAPVPMLQVDLSRGVPVDLASRLEALRPTVVLLHVLAPPLYLPEPPLREAVEVAVAQGVPAVLAHGSHAVGGVERRGATVIAWGLGNLAFDCDCTTEDEGLLVRLELSDRRVTRATVVPVRAGLHGAKAHLPDDASVDLSLLESLGSRLHAKTSSRADW